MDSRIAVMRLQSIQGKMIAGTRTAGYSDNTNGGVNYTDTNQKRYLLVHLNIMTGGQTSPTMVMA
ncbi:MAG: hypothetical protein CM15mV22_1530 [Eurybiavirus sp.]|nr:MAG: hypothetical protein CM15mV22_1530 [Eurybiavirus sp.]